MYDRNSSMVDKLILDINNALDAECYFAALMTALTLPDICGKAEYPNDGNGKRYKEWCKKYVTPHVKPSSPHGEDMPYLSDEVLYSLRNSLLHQGTPDIDIGKIKDVRCKVNKFALIITDKGSIDGGTAKVSYGANLAIREREQEISIRHICSVLCREAKKYYDNNKKKFTFINYRIIDKREKFR